jgi:electron transport complex protein RnfD
VLCTAGALAAEAAVLALRGRAPGPPLLDLSAVVTAALLALTLPPIAPWWLGLSGAVFAIVFAKQLYGGLGYNPFNPAMAGYVFLLISFPREMTLWPSVSAPGGHYLDLADSLQLALFGQSAGLTLDSVTGATPLDLMRVGLGLNRTAAEVTAGREFGSLGGTGWEWVVGGYLLGGLWLLYRRSIGWQIPVAVLGGLFLVASLFYTFDPGSQPSPLFHLFAGGAVLGAFFIATDPVTASTTPRGRLVYGIGIGVLIYVIRSWGGYPDGTAFAVLLMNLAVPTIDQLTQPRVYGERPGGG